MVDVLLQYLHEACEESGVRGQVKANSLVHNLGIADLGDGVQKEIVLPCGGALHHHFDGVVVLLVRHVKVHGRGEQTSPLASTDNLANIELAEEHLAMLHNLVGHVLGVENAQLSKDTNVSILETKSLLEQRDEVGEVAKVGVVRNNLIDVVGVLDDLKTASSSKTELLSAKAGKANLLPGGNIVGLGSSGDGLAVLLEVDVAQSELGVVVDAGEEDLGRMVQALVEASVANILDVGHVGSVDELLHLSEIIRLGKGVYELGIEEILLQGLASHLEVGDELVPDLGLVRLGAHHNVLAGVLGVDETLNGIGSALLLELGLTKARPDRLLVHLRGIRLGAIEILQEVNNNTNRRNLHLDLIVLVLGKFGPGELLVDGESFLVQHVALGNANQGNVLSIEIVKLVNVRGDTGAIGADGGEDEEVLKVLVVREVRALQNDALEERNELSGQIGSHECLDSDGNFISRSTLGKGPLHNLIDELAAVGILCLLALLLVQNLGPKIEILTLHQVLGKVAVETVGVANGNKLIVALAGTLLVGNERQGGVEALAVRTEDLGVVEHIVRQESLRITVEGDVDLTESIVSAGLGTAGCNTGLEPGLEETETIARLGTLDHLIDGAGRSDSHQNALDKVLVGTEIEQLADNLRGLGRRDLGDVNLNVLEQTVQVQVLRQLINKVETITDMDQRAGIGKLGILQILLHLLGDVNVRITADALGLLELPKLARRLNVLEVHVGVLREVDDGTEVVVQTLGGLVALKDLDEILGTELVVVLLGNLDAHLHVAGTAGHHILEQRKALLAVELAEELDDELGVHLVRVLEDALDVGDLGVVLGGALPHAGALAELANVGPVVVGEDAVLHDGVGNLGSPADEVDLQKLGLEVGVLGLVVLQCLKEEGGGLLDAVAGQEGLGGGLDVDEGTALGVDEALGQIQRSLGIVEEELAEHRGVVHLEADAGGVRDDLVVLPALDEAVDGLGVALAAQVDAEGHAGVGGHDEVAELLGALELVVLEPLLHELGPALLEDGLGELDGLLLVELAGLEEGGEVLEDGLGAAGLGGDLLEARDGGGGAEGRAGRGDELGGLDDLAGPDEALELGGVQILGAGKAEAAGDLDGKVVVAEGGGDVGDEGRAVELDADDLAGADGDAEDGPGGILPTGDEDGLLGDLGPVHGLAGVDVEHVDVAHLGKEEGEVVLLVDDEADGEVGPGVGGDGDGRRGEAEGGSLGGIAADLHDVQLVAVGPVGLALVEDEDLGRILPPDEPDGVEGPGVALEGLADLLLDGVQLHVAVDGAAGPGRDAPDEAPLLVGTDVVVDDLGVGADGRMPIKGLDGGRIALGGPVVDRPGRDEGEVGSRRPLPEHDGLRHGVALELGLGVEVEDLEGRPGPEGEDVGLRIHNGRLGLDRAAGDGRVVLEVDQRDLAGLDGHDPLVGRHGREAMLDGALGNSELLEIEGLREDDGDGSHFCCVCVFFVLSQELVMCWKAKGLSLSLVNQSRLERKQILPS
mmetsp:Transcript_27593/g.79608  ORF Transcript_27593/g.79608 Transcript_27593/m.79608 type:complete len:1497 (-) Transcript_27593:110-4600(-)